MESISAPVLLAGGAVLGAALVAIVLLVRQMRLTAEAARLGAELEAARRATDEQRTLLAQSQLQLRESFAALSKDALKENRVDFLQNADALLKPVRETLDKVQTQLREVDRDREGSYQAVTSQLGSLAQAQEQLRQTTEGLSRSLRSPNVRGKWGEIQLRRIVELSGMLAQCDFIEKESIITADGARQTPDLIVRLPGHTNIVVDAKVPIDAYLEATAASSEPARQLGLVAHARQLREHVRNLGHKDYSRQFQPAPEFVVMFLPLEPLLSAGFEYDGSLLDYAASQRVILATPMTLLALLKAVAYGWNQQHIAHNTEEIQQLGRELYERLATMVGHLENIGDGLRQSVENYNRFVGSLESKVLPSARRFKELGVSVSKDLDVPDPLALRLRSMTKEELTDSLT